MGARRCCYSHCRAGLGVFGEAGRHCVLIFSTQPGQRPPGAIFFLLRRRKNMERKTPRRAGCSPPYEPTPLGGCRWCGWFVRATRQICDCIRALIAGEQTACRFAVAYALRLWLGGFFLACWFLRLNNFHASGLAPSGGPYSFFSGEERIWKERRRAGRGVPRPTDPPPWVGVGGAGGLVSTTRQICKCIRALIAGVRAACRFAVAYALRWELNGFFAGLHPLAFQRKRLPRRRLAS